MQLRTGFGVIPAYSPSYSFWVFKLYVPVDSSMIKVHTTNISESDPKLYVSTKSYLTTTLYEHSSTNSGSNAITIRDNIKAGTTYYILVTIKPGDSFKVTATYFASV